MIRLTLLIGLILSTYLTPAFSKNAPKVGKTAAAKYFQKAPADYEYNSRGPSDEGSSLGGGSSGSSQSDHYMMVGLTSFVQSQAYRWGDANEKGENVGKWGVDVSYRISQDEYLFDQAIKISYSQYELSEKLSKIGFLYSISFPEAETRFPLYFGIAAGPGVYINQLKEESVLSLDYQLYFGLRVFDLFDRTGLFIEGGLKNHLHLLSDGQYNGTYLATGAVFAF